MWTHFSTECNYSSNVAAFVQAHRGEMAALLGYGVQSCRTAVISLNYDVFYHIINNSFEIKCFFPEMVRDFSGTLCIHVCVCACVRARAYARVWEWLLPRPRNKVIMSHSASPNSRYMTEKWMRLLLMARDSFRFFKFWFILNKTIYRRNKNHPNCFFNPQITYKSF